MGCRAAWRRRRKRSMEGSVLLAVFFAVGAMVLAWALTALLQSFHGPPAPDAGIGPCARSVMTHIVPCSAGSEAITALGGRRLVLGSASRTRSEVLSQMGLPFEVRRCDIDERAVGDRSPGADPAMLVLEVAKAKAAALLPQVRSLMAAKPQRGAGGADALDVEAGAEDEQQAALLLTCDQVVLNGGRILEKPCNAEEATRFLKQKGCPHPDSTVGSVVLTDVATGRQLSGVEVSTVFFDPFPEPVVEALVEEGEVLHCAGALMVEHPLVARQITATRGSKGSIMGLSEKLVTDLLFALGD